jgi:hypothetical protein
LKFRKHDSKENETRSEGKLVALPVRLCEPHPDLQTRLRYDQVDALAEDIRVHGQLQPGRAIEKPDGTGYFVYVGIGRLFAVKKLFDKEGGPKSYYALLDEGLPFVELFSRSMSENLKRRNLSVLEEVRSFYLASQKASEEEIVAASSNIGEEPAAVRRRIELARILGDKLEKLYDIEAKSRTGFSFQLGHLDALTEIREDRALYEAAAAAAHSRFSVKELQSSLRNKSMERVASGLPEWFYEIFPEYAKKAIGQGSGGSGVASVDSGTTVPTGQHFMAAPGSQQLPPATDGQAPGTSTIAKATAPGSHPPPGVPYRENQPFTECPHCGARIPFELKEDSELTIIRFKGAAVPEKDTVAPEGLYRDVRTCINPECGEQFWLWVTAIDGELRAETRRKEDGEEGWFGLPQKRPFVGSVSWSADRQSWMVKEKESGKLYVYREDGMFVEA